MDPIYLLMVIPLLGNINMGNLTALDSTSGLMLTFMLELLKMDKKVEKENGKRDKLRVKPLPTTTKVSTLKT